MANPIRIAIIGAGPAGCMLARILSLSDIAATVFESDASPNYRSQGGTLDLHPKTGLAAMQDAQLFDQFRKAARYDGDYYLWTGKDCVPWMTMGPSMSNSLERPEIDRADLRRILTESLPEGTIWWGHRLQRVEMDDSTGASTLVFEHGATESGFDLVVGAEGAWSKVRSVLTDVKPHYTGIGYTMMDVPDAATTAPALHALVNRGNVFAFGTGQKLSVQQMGDGSLHVAYSAVRREDWVDSCGYDPCNLEQARAALLNDEMSDWSPRLREAIEKAGGNCQAKNLYMLPVGFRWAHRSGLTLIGDAAHLMAPTAGEGVNVSLDDARRLAAAIVRATAWSSSEEKKKKKEVAPTTLAGALDREVRAFEEEMFPRAEEFQRLTDDLTQMWMFSDGDVKKVMPRALLRHVQDKVPTGLYPLAWLGRGTKRPELVVTDDRESAINICAIERSCNYRRYFEVRSRVQNLQCCGLGSATETRVQLAQFLGGLSRTELAFGVGPAFPRLQTKAPGNEAFQESKQD
ncbi:hypothetical protein K438DRAFT_1935767 [Mycena galopus ATCC 62051]|nr:hypothetical protein K438DRAFT_1935767 [Mycena galopus ATCC 62051]